MILVWWLTPGQSNSFGFWVDQFSNVICFGNKLWKLKHICIWRIQRMLCFLFVNSDRSSLRLGAHLDIHSMPVVSFLYFCFPLSSQPVRFFSEGIKWKRDRGQFISIPLWLRKLIKSTRKNTDKANVTWTRSLGSTWQLVNCISSEVGWNTKPRSSYNFRIGEGPGILFHQYCFHWRHDNTLEEEDWGSWPAPNQKWVKFGIWNWTQILCGSLRTGTGSNLQTAFPPWIIWKHVIINVF